MAPAAVSPVRERVTGAVARAGIQPPPARTTTSGWSFTVAQSKRLFGLVAAGGGSHAARELQFQRIKTLEDLQREVAAASVRGQPVMLDFYADWCVSCKEMEKYTFSDPRVIEARHAEDQALLQDHFGLPGPPAIMFYGADGQERKNYRVVGFKPADEFAEHVGNALR